MPLHVLEWEKNYVRAQRVLQLGWHLALPIRTETACSEGGISSKLDDVCPVSRILFGFILTRSLSWPSYLSFHKLLALLPSLERSGCMFCRTYMGEVVSDASHGFDTCILEVTLPALNNLGTPTNHSEA